MDTDYVILGAGPAGVQATYHMKKLGMSFVCLERNSIPGSFFTEHPRHRTLISINKRFNIFPEDDFNMRHDWNSLVSEDTKLRFTNYTDKLFPHTDYLVEYMADFAEKLGLNQHIHYNTTVKKISRCQKTGKFSLATESGKTYTCKRLIMATGAMKEKLPKVPGVELCDTYATHSLDLKHYENKSVAIIGGGNSAFEVGDHIAPAAGFVHFIFRQPYCKMAWDTHFVGDVRAINNSVIDMYHLKSLFAFRSADIKGFRKPENGEEGVVVDMDIAMPHWSPPVVGHIKGRYDRVIIATGWQYIEPELFDENCRPGTVLDGKFPDLDEMWQTTVPDMYYIGTASQAKDRKAASGFIHGFRYTAGVLCHMLRHKYDHARLPEQIFPKGVVINDVAEFIIKRMSTVSSLYQMNQGTLCDVMIFHDKRRTRGPNGGSSYEPVKGMSMEYIKEVPANWVKKQKNLMNNDLVWIITLGDSRYKYPSVVNPTSFSKPPDMNVDNNGCSGFMEPRFEVFRNGKPQGFFYIGGSVTVRHDIPQLPGGNPRKSTNKVKNWLSEQLDLGFPKEDVSLYSPKMHPEVFTIMTEEDIRKCQEKQKKVKPPLQCHLFDNIE